jgi:isoleucyl-tRNA synthetase
VFPAQFIAEGQDQTRGWFYTLHVLATALTRGEEPSIPVKESVPAFQHVIVNGIVLAEDGKKMSKRLKNYPDPTEVLEKYGADAMRYYLVSSPAMHAESLNFSEAGVREMYNKVVNMLANVVEFWQMFEGSLKHENLKALKQHTDSNHILDRWILAKLQELVREVTEGMNAYKLAEASRPIELFIAELSQWYVRRSRDRFKGSDEQDKEAAIATLREVLLTLAKVMAPFTPFIAEKIYRDMGGDMESVHLETWPEANKNWEDRAVLEKMTVARNIVEIGLALRAEAGIKIRQVLGEVVVEKILVDSEIKNIICDELNVKEIVDAAGKGDFWKGRDGDKFAVLLNTEITEALKKEGMVREIVRAINQLRKDMGLTIRDRVAITYATQDDLLRSAFSDYEQEIMKAVLADSVRIGAGKAMEIDGRGVEIGVEVIK